jgi:hypothetical protein
MGVESWKIAQHTPYSQLQQNRRQDPNHQSPNHQLQSLEGEKCRVTIYAKLENPEDISKLQNRELTVSCGDHTKQSKEVAKYVGIQVL